MNVIHHCSITLAQLCENNNTLCGGTFNYSITTNTTTRPRAAPTAQATEYNCSNLYSTHAMEIRINLLKYYFVKNKY